MKKHLFPLVLIAAAIFLWVYFLPELPKVLSIHWSLSGEVNGTATKGNAFAGLVSIMVFLYALFIWMPKIDPKRENYKYFTKGYRTITNAVLTLLFLVNLFVILTGLGYHLPIAHLGGVVVGAIWMVLVNFLQQVRTNYFIGIRTPWTLSSETVWRKTHRFSGKVFFFAGILLILLPLFSMNWVGIGTLAIIIAAVVLPIFYSYLKYRDESKTRL